MRIRTLKPEFWTSETIANLSDFAKLMAIGLLNYADDEGYFWANPILIRAAIFPFQDRTVIIDKAISELQKAGFIQLGRTTDGRMAGRVVNFALHQRIDRPKPSIISQNSTFDDQSTINQRQVDEGSLLEGKGKEGNGTGKGGMNGGALSTLPTVELIQTLQANPAYKEIDVSKEFHRMEAWCSTNKKRPSAKRFVNWLNRIDRPLDRMSRATGPNI